MNRADDVALFGVGELGIDRQGEGLAGRRFGLRKIARLVAQRGEAGLQVERDRIVDLGADLPRRQMVAKRIAERRGNADDELVVDMEVARPLDRQADHRLQAVRDEQAAVASRNLPAQAGPGVKVAELHPEHGRLERVEPGVETDLMVMVLRLHAMHAEPGHPAGQLRVVGRDHAPIAEAAQVLGRVEAERGHVAERHRPASP